MYIQIELTDTFGGESNYSWVKRYRLEHKPGETDRALMRRVKSALGWSGIRCRVSSLNYMIDIRPAGAALVAFVTWEE
jgi:hypothetical protein